MSMKRDANEPCHVHAIEKLLRFLLDAVTAEAGQDLIANCSGFGTESKDSQRDDRRGGVSQTP